MTIWCSVLTDSHPHYCLAHALASRHAKHSHKHNLLLGYTLYCFRDRYQLLQTDGEYLEKKPTSTTSTSRSKILPRSKHCQPPVKLSVIEKPWNTRTIVRLRHSTVRFTDNVDIHENWWLFCVQTLAGVMSTARSVHRSVDKCVLWWTRDDVWSYTSTAVGDGVSESGSQLTWTTSYIATQRRLRHATTPRPSLRLWTTSYTLRHSATGSQIHRPHDPTTHVSTTHRRRQQTWTFDSVFAWNVLRNVKGVRQQNPPSYWRTLITLAFCVIYIEFNQLFVSRDVVFYSSRFYTNHTVPKFQVLLLITP